MSFIYTTPDKIYCTGNINVNINNYIQSNDIKQICYGIDIIAILLNNNNLMLFRYKDEIQPTTLKYNERIKHISLKTNILLILDETNKIKYTFLNNTSSVNNIKLELLFDDSDILSINSFNWGNIIHINHGLYYFGNGDIDILKDKIYNIGGIVEEVNINWNIEEYKLIKIFDLIKFNYESIHFSQNGFAFIKDDKLIDIGCIGYNIDYIYYNKYTLPSDYENFKIKKIISVSYNGSYIFTESGRLYVSSMPKGKIHLNANNLYFRDYWVMNNNFIYISYKGEFFINYDLIDKNKNINYIIDKSIDLIWKPENNINYPSYYQKNILLILLFIKHIYKIYNIKIPKYVLYMIINFTI